MRTTFSILLPLVAACFSLARVQTPNEPDMRERAKITFEISSWDEETFDEEGDSKLARASVLKTYRGQLEGEGTVEQLAAYRSDGSAVFTALERFRGRLGERTGSFVLRHEGTFEKGIVRATWTVVPGTATGDLIGLHGAIAFEAGHQSSYDVVLEYGFE